MNAPGIIFAGGVLAICTVQDIRHKRIQVVVPAVGMVFGAVTALWQGGPAQGSVQGILMGLLPGLVVVLLALLLPGTIGTGDGLMLMAVGAACGAMTCIMVFLAGLMLAFPAAFFVGVVRGRRAYRLPFAPFLLGGYVCVIILEMF